MPRSRKVDYLAIKLDGREHEVVVFTRVFGEIASGYQVEPAILMLFCIAAEQHLNGIAVVVEYLF
jgi:hypothetical protein